MSCNWKTLPLGEILELVIDHRGKTPKKLGFKDFQTEGYPVLSAKHVKTSGLVNLDSIRYANLEMYKKWMKVPVQEGDVVLTSEAPMGETFFIDGSIDYVLGQRLFGLRPKKELIEPRYLMAWLSSEVGQNKLKQRASGSTVQGIKQAELLKIEIDVPPLRTQKIIANNEAYISKKINLNKKLNQTLEQIAQAIFKSWFVDFEPVKAKIKVLEAGGSEEDAILAAMQAISDKDKAQLTQLQTENPENYNQLRTTAELFPSAMQDSELGEIPEGWNYGLLSDISELNKSSWTKRTLPSEIEYVDLANTKKGIIENTSRYAANEAPSRARRKLSKGDTIIGTVRPGNRSYAFIYDDSNMLTGSTGFAVLTPENRHFAEFLYIKATSEQSIDYLAHLADGGAYPAVRPEVVSSVPSILPSDALVRRFHHTVSPYFKSIGENNKESSLLTKVKLALLPKLLSGEILMAHANESLEVD